MNESSLILLYEPVVERIVRRYRTLPYIDLDDLRQEGRIGLLTALRRYRPDRGASFETYAAWWVRKYVVDFLKRYGYPVHKPLRVKQGVVWERASLDEHEPWSADAAPDRLLEQAEQRERVDRALAALRPRDRRIVCELNGWDTDPRTVRELACDLHLSADRIRRLHRDALRRLRQALATN
ncbi:MAG: sigma-70 family RNA polymerase sigma factor [Paludibacteraceae bacterium]